MYGLNDKVTKKQEIATLEAYKVVTNIISSYEVTGFTIYETSGYYIHQDKSVSIEKSLKIEIMFVELETIKAIIEQLKKVLNQESIILQTEKIKSELV